MDQSRPVAVLFADISGSTKLYESQGDKIALEAIARCLDLLRQAVENSNGRLVKTIGDEVMAVFPSADTAAFAANNMHLALDALPPLGNDKLAVRIGFHFGPVIQKDNDLFGDTVNLAARLVEQAAKDQIITSRETADLLSTIFHTFKRPLYSIHVKGKAEEVELCELIWRKASDLTISDTTRTLVKIKPVVLRLVYGDTELIRRRENESVSIGRHSSCAIQTLSKWASRMHCCIERRKDKFILSDQSTNGTFVTPEGGAEVELRREEFTLGSHGWIAIGQTKTEADAIIEYFCT